MRILEAQLITGGLSHTSKMPCPSFSLPATACKTGSRLAEVPGTVCSKCYAMKGNYVRFASVREASYRRLELLEHWVKEDPDKWVEAMVTLIRNSMYFRWHDSGDVQHATHMDMIEDVARACPETQFWLPTHEVWVAKRGALPGAPENLVVRLSAAKIGGPPSSSAEFTCTVHRKLPQSGAVCLAHENGNRCGTCRKCWDKSVKNVAYLFH